MIDQVLVLIILLAGIGVMLGGLGFLKRIGSMISGCIQFVLTTLIMLLLLLVVLYAGCSALLEQ